MEPFVTSRYIRTVRRPEGHAVYHSLFGGLALLDDEALALLRFHDSPASLGAAAELPRYRHASERVRRLVQEFQSRAFLVPDDFDERSIVDDEIESRLATCHTGNLVRALQLVVANECNFRCKYCFVKTMWTTPERTELQASPTNQRMTPEVARQAMDASLGLVRRHGHGALHVEFFGGEPLTNWPLVEGILQQYGASSDGVAIGYSITTNGSLVTEAIARTLAQHAVTVAMSFDSPTSTDRVLAHSAQRSGRELLGGKLRLLRDAGNRVNFNSVLSKDTARNFDGKLLVDYAIEHGVAMIGLILDLDPEFYQDEELKRITADKVIETHRYGNERGLPIVGYWHQTFAQLAGRQGHSLRTGYKSCPAEGCKLSVEPDGHLFVCKCCGTQLGTIADLDVALASETYREYARKGFQAAPECAGCEIEGFCSGVCMGAIEKRYGKLGTIEPAACSLFREITERLITGAPASSIARLALAEPAAAQVSPAAAQPA